MPKPHEDRVVKSDQCAPARTPKIHSSRANAINVCMGLVMAVFSGQTLSQPVLRTSVVQEQRRAEERERSQREEQERAPDIRLEPPALDRVDRLPTEETCFVIMRLTLKSAPGETSAWRNQRIVR